MKASLASLLLALVTFAATAAENAAPADWTGKTVAIKTTNGGSSCIRIQNFVVSVGQPDKAAPDASVFKVVSGTAEGTVGFESVANPGMFLQHSSYHIVLLKGMNDSALFRIAAPLRGNQGVSFQSYNFPTHHIALVEKDHLEIATNLKEPRKAIFYLEEKKK